MGQKRDLGVEKATVGCYREGVEKALEGRRVGACQISLIHNLPAKAAISTIQLNLFVGSVSFLKMFRQKRVSHLRTWAEFTKTVFDLYSLLH